MHALPFAPLLTRRPYQSLADLLDWQSLVALDPVVMTTKTGLLVTTMRYSCPDTEHLPLDVRTQYLGRLHAVLASLGAGWAADFEWRHTAAAPYPEATWPTPVHWLVDEVRRHEYTAVPRHESQAYLTLTWQPPAGYRRWLSGLFVARHVKNAQGRLDGAILHFQAAVLRTAGELRSVLPTVELLSPDAFCTFLHSAISADTHTITCPWPADALAEQLTSEAMTPGFPLRLGNRLLQTLRIKTWHPALSTWLPEALAQLPFPCVSRVRWVPMSSAAAEKYLAQASKERAQDVQGMLRGRRELGPIEGRGVDHAAMQAGTTLEVTRADVQRGDETLGRLTLTLGIDGADEGQLTERVQLVETLCYGQGLVVQREEAGNTLSWLASLPAQVCLGLRAIPLRTTELAALMPHATVWSGPPRDGHLQAPPLLTAVTGSTVFRLVSHYGELGHVLVAGPSRSGKSGLLGLLAHQWLRYPGARVAMFDRDHALKAAAVLGGGAHYALGAAPGLVFQPLAAVDTDAGRQWGAAWLDALLSGEGLTPSAEEREQLFQALGRLATLPSHERTLSIFRTLLPVQRLKVGLGPYCAGAPYAYLDGDHDSLALESRQVCFEMSGLLAAPRALAATFAHIVHVLERSWFTGAPILLIVDEAKWLLDVAAILGEVELWLKGRAKKNVSVIVCSQELYDLERTTAWQAIQGSIPTKILLPNPSAGRTDVAPFYRSIGCDESDVHTLTTATPLRDYYYLSPAGKALFQLKLDPIQRALCAASRLEDLALLDRLQATVPPDLLPIAWCKAQGLEEAALLLEEAQEAQTLDAQQKML